ncbi:Zinc finger and SCAN domain-containing 22 [Paramuricea clavata]|uniref:Zinc finger and SCAN domain-containing 22 n=1 Tax=Paramuricea clavata TaxID=317549 RepID=A0A7D9IPT1_PARCT|nr:Zinc finger and SCAN domain-containing 22 [Paramuricea clavata]
MHERRGAEREYTCNICGELFQNIFPFQAHQRDVHEVGGVNRKWKRNCKSGSSIRQAKRTRTDGPEPPRPSTPVNEDSINPPNDLASSLHRQHRRVIRMRQSRGNRLQDWYNYRMSSSNMGQLVDDQNNIRNLENLQQVREALQNIDIHEWAQQQRLNSKMVVMDFTNATFYVTKLRDHPIENCKAQLKQSIIPEAQQKEFLADIFGRRCADTRENGLVDAKDENDLRNKLFSCKEACNNEEGRYLPPGQKPKFYDYILILTLRRDTCFALRMKNLGATNIPPNEQAVKAGEIKDKWCESLHGVLTIAKIPQNEQTVKAGEIKDKIRMTGSARKASEVQKKHKRVAQRQAKRVREQEAREREGLVGAKDENDLRNKLLSCKEAWNKEESRNLPPGQKPKFYDYILILNLRKEKCFALRMKNLGASIGEQKRGCCKSLVDAKDENDLRNKLFSCKEAWNKEEGRYLPPGQKPKFYDYILILTLRRDTCFVLRMKNLGTSIGEQKRGCCKSTLPGSSFPGLSFTIIHPA